MSGSCSSSTSTPAERAFRDFIRILSAHIAIVGGMGDIRQMESLKEMTLEEAFMHLFPNDIILGFKNLRMKEDYQNVI